MPSQQPRSSISGPNSSLTGSPATDKERQCLAESLIGTFKAELIDRQAWRRRDELEFAVVEWVGWYNTPSAA
jgi:hypothetical protein